MKKILTLLIIMFISLSCEKKNESIKAIKTVSNEISNDDNMYDEADTETEEVINSDDLENILKKLEDDDIKIKNKNIKTGKYTIDKSYLKDELDFKSIDSSKITGSFGVISTNYVKMYSDLSADNVITELPRGSVIDIIEEIINKNPTEDEFGDTVDFFQFHSEYNYWYKVAYQGKNGYVFGSYILTSDKVKNLISKESSNIKYEDSKTKNLLKVADYYKYDTYKNDKFTDYNGQRYIPDDIKKSLIQDKFALESVNYYEYQDQLNIENPDDMVALYKNLHADEMVNTYITIDFLVHSLHLLFDKMLQDTESKIMFPTLQKLCIAYYQKLEEMKSSLSENDIKLKESIELMQKYFLVGGNLAGGSVVTSQMNGGDLTGDVLIELNKIEKAEGFSESEIFKYMEDYSQFKPRGHYTKNENLKKYFKSMIWFGRLHFYAQLTGTPQDIENSVKLTRAALLLTKITKDNKNIYAMWKALFNPITYIIGESDDYNLNQYLEVSKNVDFDNFGLWIDNEDNVKEFIKYANTNIAPPKISGNTLLQQKDSEKKSLEIPGGFRLFGQRFTFDSFIHNQLSAPRIIDRTMVKGLDIMAAFGNKFSETLLKEDKDIYGGYAPKLASLQTQVEGFDTMDWRKTFFNSYLKVIKESANFGENRNFYFTQSEKWNNRTLITAHGAWAELRHDTILYVKQSYAEKAGKGPEKTWVYDAIDKPIGYIEPNLDALYWIESILEDTVDIISESGFMTKEYSSKFEAYKSIISDIVIIAEKEAADEPISERENDLIYDIPYRLANIIIPSGSSMGYTERKDFQMALVADVHTDSDNGVVIEVAVGVPNRIYVAINDKQGGKRIAEGYTFSYYEFPHPMNDRLNNDQWKEKVYNNGNESYLMERMPQWEKDILIK